MLVCFDVVEVKLFSVCYSMYWFLNVLGKIDDVLKIFV